MTKQAHIDISVAEADGCLVISPQGDWTVYTVGAVDAELRALPKTECPPIIDLGQLDRIDTAGAYLLDRTAHQTSEKPEELMLIGEHEMGERLLRQVSEARREEPRVAPIQHFGVLDWLSRIGEGTVVGIREGLRTLSFVGETIAVCIGLVLRPAKFRATATVAVMEEAGLDAIPIVMFLTFFVGMVVAFIGATTLGSFGATIFTVELVGYSMLREFGVILTAIILAGRTNSAFTAQIGAMRMRQEVDAMQVLGLDPMEVLVAPRVIAMLVMTPILAFLATISGIFGGLVVSWLALDIGPTLFLSRLVTTVPIENFWVGISKAPFFAMVVALIGCRQGLGVGGSVQSLGTSTTNSVVQALFSIIVIDAVFAMFYMQLGV
ncbi:MAG: MlaE family lipid ABC transporter permease subunit [Hyphomonadaceae bacterium]